MAKASTSFSNAPQATPDKKNFLKLFAQVYLYRSGQLQNSLKKNFIQIVNLQLSSP